MEDKLSKRGNYKRSKKGSNLEYGNSGPDILVHPLFKISGSAPGRFASYLCRYLVLDTFFVINSGADPDGVQWGCSNPHFVKSYFIFMGIWGEN